MIPLDRAFQTRENLHKMLYKINLEKLLGKQSRNIIGGHNILTSQQTQDSYANRKEGYIFGHIIFMGVNFCFLVNAMFFFI